MKDQNKKTGSKQSAQKSTKASKQNPTQPGKQKAAKANNTSVAAKANTRKSVVALKAPDYKPKHGQKPNQGDQSADQIDRKANRKAAKQAKREQKAARRAEKAKQANKNKTNKIDKKFLKLNKAGIITSLVVVFVLVVSGIGIGVWSSVNNRPEEVVEEVEPEPEPEPEPEEPELPEENPDELQAEPTINDNAAYQVAAYKPRFLSIPSIGLYNIPVTELGTENGNQLSSPRSDRVIGWYYVSALPGVPGGTALMNGHGGALGTGILKNLPNIKIGDEIIVEMGDGRKFTYAVADKVYRKIGAEADAYMGPIQESPRPGTASLSLITCTGTWLPAQRTYDQRLFVRALIR